jgi:hypothetical protein
LYDIASQARHYGEFGCDFRFQTDHMTVDVPAGKPAGRWLHAADWERYRDDCRKASTAAHLVVPGVELVWEVEDSRRTAEGWCDVKLYPPGKKVAPPETFYAGLSFAGALTKLKSAGCHVVIAHVDQGVRLEKLTGAEIDGLEVRSDIEETRPLVGRPSLVHWDRMLAAGHRVSLSSGSDAHQPDLWAGSGLRTVVRYPAFEADAVLDAVIAGRSYLSGTWHPDCYGALGCPVHPNGISGGLTRFTPWWDFARIPALKERRPGDVVEEIFGVAMKKGRCRREDYPELAEFKVNGTPSGGETAAGKAEVRVGWRAHLPVTTFRLVADGRTIYEAPGNLPAQGESVFSVDLTGRRYVRLEIEATDTAVAVKRESLLANPVYLKR